MQNPADFSKYNPNTPRQAEHFLKKHKDDFIWRDAEEILEIGCADGSITKDVLYPFVENHLKNLVAVDISASAIDGANSTNTNPKISFQVMDIGDIKEGDKHPEKFDKIFAFYCFHLVKPAEVWPKNVSKMLKHKGQVFGSMLPAPNFITDVIDEQLADVEAPWNKYMQNKPEMITNYGSKPTEAIAKVLTDAGLVVDAIDVEATRSTYEEKENLEKTIGSYCFFFKYMPEELKETYKQDFIRRIFNYVNIDENGHHYYTPGVVSFVATKP